MFAESEYSSKSNNEGTTTTSNETHEQRYAEARREYQRQYYQLHKEKAKEYQRQYNLTHKKTRRGQKGTRKAGGREEVFIRDREVIRSTYNLADLMSAPMGLTDKILQKIIKCERLFTMNSKDARLYVEQPSIKGLNPTSSIHRIIDNTNR
ncbi:MAG: hypothetical protein AABW51_04645 [Nanoarchaeota archaeon]